MPDAKPGGRAAAAAGPTLPICPSRLLIQPPIVPTMPEMVDCADWNGDTRFEIMLPANAPIFPGKFPHQFAIFCTSVVMIGESFPDNWPHHVTILPMVSGMIAASLPGSEANHLTMALMVSGMMEAPTRTRSIHWKAWTSVLIPLLTSVKP